MLETMVIVGTMLALAISAACNLKKYKILYNKELDMLAKLMEHIEKQTADYEDTIARLNKKLVELQNEHTELEGDYAQISHSLMIERSINNMLDGVQYRVMEVDCDSGRMIRKVSIRKLRDIASQ